MAIETTYIYDTSHATLLAWLQEKAVPTYFDRVEADASTSTTIYCYVGDTKLLTFKYGQYGGTAVKITTASGLSKDVTVTDMTAYAFYGYTCAGGLAISVGLSYTVHEISIFITKDTGGNTVIITGTSTNANIKAGVNAITAQDVVLDTLGITQRTTSATTIVPFICGCAEGESRYTTNAFYMPTVQYTTKGKLMIDGVAYLSNGAWLLKDQ